MISVATPSRTTQQTRTEPQSPRAWRRGFENLSREHGFIPLRVEGKLPAELHGTLYRNGPGKFDVAGERYRHWFDGDGAVCAVRLDGKSAAFGAAKLVETPWRERERRAGKRLFGGYDTPAARPVRELLLGDVKNPANTSVMIHDGRLYALCEGGKPFEISTEDLSTIGEADLDGVVTRTFSAHPHRVASRRTTYGFGLAVGRSTRVECYALRDGDRARRIASFAIEGQRMNHDFAVTSRHLVFFFAPVYFSLWSALMGRGFISGSKYRAERGTEVAVVPIDDPSKVVRFRVPAFYMEHVVNAFELPGGEIAVDYIHYEHLRDLEDFVSGLPSGTPKRPLASTLRRAIVNVSTKTVRIENQLDEAVELPRVSPLVETNVHRFSYAVSFKDGASPPLEILKHDLKGGAVERYAPGPDRYPSEAVFIPRKGAGERRGSGSQSEDDGWLLTLVLDAKRGTTDLEVLDAARLANGPIARCHFEQAIPFGFHGVWNPAR